MNSTIIPSLSSLSEKLKAPEPSAIAARKLYDVLICYDGAPSFGTLDTHDQEDWAIAWGIAVSAVLESFAMEGNK